MKQFKSIIMQHSLFLQFALNPVIIKLMGNCVLQKPPSQKTNYSKSKFRYIEKLGKGAFGQVWKVELKTTRQIFALKIMDKAKLISKKSVKAILQEKLILQTLAFQRSDFIVNIKGTFQDRQKVYILTEYINGTALNNYIYSKRVKFSESEVNFLVRKLFEILRYLHGKKIIHGDIKPNNIIIDQYGLPHLVDFGTAAFYERNNSYQNGGTLPYMAPEVLMGLNHSYSVDYYAVGVLAFQLLFKRRPFTAITSQELKQQIIDKEFNTENFPQLEKLSDGALDFITKLLCKEREERMGCHGIQEIFNHPWLKADDNALLVNQRECQYHKEVHSLEEKSKKLVEDDETSTPLQEVLNLLGRPHIQQMFKAFDQPSRTHSTLMKKKFYKTRSLISEV